MLDFTYTIGASDEIDRMMVVFANPEAQQLCALHLVPNVGSRRNQDNVTTHYVFPAAREAEVRQAVAKGALRHASSSAQMAAPTTASPKVDRAKAAQASKAALIESWLSRNSVDLDFKHEYSGGGFYVSLPYASGTPSLLKAAGGVFKPRKKAWYFSGGFDEVWGLVPQLKRLVAAQKIKDAKPKAVRAKSIKPSRAVWTEQDEEDSWTPPAVTTDRDDRIDW